MSFDVIVSGLNVVDLLVTLPKHYTLGRKHQVDAITIQGGAPAGNGACAMASLGLETAFLGFLGNNPQSHIARSEFARCGVDTSLMMESFDAVPATALVEVEADSGERTVFYSTQGYQALSATDVKEEWLEDTRLVYVDGYDLEGNLELLKRAKRLGIPSVVDMEAGDPDKLTLMLKLASHAILPLEAAQDLTGCHSPQEALSALNQLTEAQLVVTDGSNGSWAVDGESILHQRCFEVAVVDTTGCGDAYHAAYAYALLQGYKLAERMKFASAFAAIVATHFGGRTYFPSPQEVDAFIQKYA